jgi:hypothetical protein
MTWKCDNCGSDNEDSILRCTCGKETSDDTNVTKIINLNSDSIIIYKILRLSLIIIILSAIFIGYYKSADMTILEYPIKINCLFTIIYLILLGILVRRTKRNVPLWILLTFATNIPGFIISFMLMRKIAKDSTIIE